MSFHMDKEEFDEWVAEGAFELIWSAYTYAIDGAEPSVVDSLRKQVKQLESQNTLPYRRGVRGLRDLTKEQRLAAMCEFCWHCGAHDPKHECNCKGGGSHEV